MPAMSLDAYLDLAIARHGLKSDRELSYRLGFAGGTQVWRYRKKGDLPTQDAVIRLAELCGLDPAEAVVDLSMWKATDEKTLGVLERMKEIIRNAHSSVAVLLAVVLTVAFAALDPSVAKAGTMLERTAVEARPLYIMGNLYRAAADLISAALAPLAMLAPRVNHAA